jgi:hypothetical protein
VVVKQILEHLKNTTGGSDASALTERQSQPAELPQRLFH